MPKVIEIKDGTLESKIRCIGSMFFGTISDTELAVLVQLVLIGENGQLNLTTDASKTICKAINLNPNSLSVCIHRLTKKQAINKRNSVITFHPIINSFLVQNEYVIRFVTAPMKST